MAPAAEEADATLPVARRKRRRLLVLVGLAAVGLTAILASLVVFGGRNSKQPGTYVALGDSYASGEGLGPFEAGTEDVARSGDGCHRSANAYPRLVAAEGLKVIFVACSGAKVADLVGGQAPQAALVDKRATLVTVTIGGNDAQWTEVLTVCGLVENCPTAPMPASPAGPSGGATVSEFVVRQLEGLAGPLRESFEQLRRSAPNATMLVTGYPLPLPCWPTSSTRPNGSG